MKRGVDMYKKYSESERVAIINEINASKGDKTQLCEKLGIAKSTYWKWNKKYRNNKVKTSKFVELGKKPIKNIPKEIRIEVNNLKIVITDDIDLLRKIVNGIKSC